MRTCYVYFALHRKSGRVYVGKSVDPDVRWRRHLREAKNGSPTWFHVALFKYGREAFDFWVGQVFDSDEEALLAEKDWFVYLQEQGIVLFNLAEGGAGGARTKDDVRRKLSLANTGKVFSEEHRRHISESKTGANHPAFGKKGAMHPQYGRKRTPEQIARIKAGRWPTK